MNNLRLKGFSCLSTAVGFLLLLFAILFAKMAVFEFYRVTSASMENTLLVDDFLLIDKLTYGARTPNKVVLPLINRTLPLHSFKLPQLREIKAGDVVVFRAIVDFSSHLMVKRCVAVAGQTVEIRQKQLLVDNRPADSLLTDAAGIKMIVNSDSVTFPADYIDPLVNPFGGNNRDNFGPLVVPDGTIFVLGDNRDLSLDSRYFGTVSTQNVIGRAVMIYYSCKNDPDSSRQNVNWLRLGRFIK